jgi:hypothetical protein
MVDGELDEGRRAEDGAVDRDAGQTGLQLFEHLLDSGGDIEGVSPGLLFDDEEDAVAVIDDRVADQGGMADLDLRDIAEADGGTVAELDDGAGEVLRRGDEGELVDGEPQVRRVDESARADHCGIAGRFRDGIEGDAGGAKFLGIDEHLELLVPLAPDGHVGDARHGHEAGRIVQRAISLSSIWSSVSERRPTFKTRLNEEYGAISTGGFTTAGRRFCARLRRSCTSCRALRMSVPVLKIITTEERPRTDLERIVLRKGRPLSEFSSGTVTSAVDFLGGKAGRLRLHLDEGRGELGEDIQGRVLRGIDADDEQRQPPRRRARACSAPRRQWNSA